MTKKSDLTVALHDQVMKSVTQVNRDMDKFTAGGMEKTDLCISVGKAIGSYDLFRTYCNETGSTFPGPLSSLITDMLARFQSLPGDSPDEASVVVTSSMRKHDEIEPALAESEPEPIGDEAPASEPDYDHKDDVRNGYAFNPTGAAREPIAKPDASEHDVEIVIGGTYHNGSGTQSVVMCVENPNPKLGDSDRVVILWSKLTRGLYELSVSDFRKKMNKL